MLRRRHPPRPPRRVVGPAVPRPARDAPSEALEACVPSWVVRSVAHDLGNVLAAVTNHLYLLSEDVGDAPDDVRLDRLSAVVEHAAMLVHELVALGSAGDTGRSLVVDLAEEARGLERLLSGIAGPEVALTVTGGPVCPASVPVVDLARVLASLVADARAAGARRVEIAVSRCRAGTHRLSPVTSAAPGEVARVAVSDDGPGLPRHAHAAVGGTFGAPLPAHRGPGLRVVRTLVERSGGALEIGTSDAGGATVAALFPLAP